MFIDQLLSGNASFGGFIGTHGYPMLPHGSRRVARTNFNSSKVRQVDLYPLMTYMALLKEKTPTGPKQRNWQTDGPKKLQHQPVEMTPGPAWAWKMCQD